jgi:DNA polymerase-3 subunit delta
VTPDELHAELVSGTLRPAYLVAGEENVLRDDAVSAIRSAVLADGPVDFNVSRFDGDRVTPAELEVAVATLPVMAAHRLVLVREPEARRGTARELTDAIEAAVASLRDRLETVLLVVAAKVDRRSRWVRAFADPAVLVRCDPPREARQVVAFARAEAVRQGVALARGAAELLVERTGRDLGMLRQEIAKVSLIAGPGETVTPAHAAAGTGDFAEESIFALTDAVGEGRSAAALCALARILRTGAPPPVVLAALAAHTRRLVRLRHGGSVDGPPFVRRKLQGQAQRFTAPRLRACLRAIHETDTALKGEGALRPEMALERLVIGLSS